MKEVLTQFYTTYPWRSLLLVFFVVFTFAFDATWAWGFFWLWWAVMSLRSGEFIFLDVVSKGQHPILFWVLLVCWVVIGLSYFAYEFFPTYLRY